MSNEELQALVAANAQAIARLEINSANQARAAEIQAQGFTSLLASAESQVRTMELMREGMSHNTEMMANALEISAISQRTAAAAQESAAASQQSAAAAFELSANTARNLDRLEIDIAEMKVMLGIIIKDNQADRARISGLEQD